MTRALVVGRLRKGRRIRFVVGQVERALSDAGWKVEASVVKRKLDLRRSAADAVKDGCDVVVAVGGDGAVLQVASSLVKTKVALGIIPMGTGNLLAGNLKIPTDPAKAARALVDGRHRRIDVGQVTVDGGKRYTFTVACGVGFDAKVMERTEASQKLRWGKLAYFAHAISEAGGIHNVPHEFTLDGVTTATEAAQVLIANFGRMSAGVKPDRAIEPDDGMLDVIVVRASGRLSGLLAGWEALRQKHLGESGGGRAMRAQARDVRVETTPSQLVEVDGSVVGRTPITASIVPHALTVIVPAT
jgi:diacylglycerol kinase (ATP)